jgi:hypothetical protein
MVARLQAPDPWAALPNADLIDRVLHHVQYHMTLWALANQDQARWNSVHTVGAADTAWDVVNAAGRDVMAHAAIDRVSDVCWTVMRSYPEHDTSHDAACRLYVAARYAVSDVVLALVAWDDCAELLTLSPNQLRMMERLGHPGAILLWPAAAVLPWGQKSSKDARGRINTVLSNRT